MAIPQIMAEVLANKKLTKDIYETTFKMIEPSSLAFKSGQHLIFEINSRAVRQYSIASAPQEIGKFELCVDVLPKGPGSLFIEALKPGDKVKCRGPWGRFLLSEANLPHKVFVATGVGVTPFRSMILDLFATGFNGLVDLYFGVRHEEDIFYFDQFENLAGNWPMFNFLPTLSRPSVEWKGLQGRVTDHLRVAKFDVTRTEFYICGSGQMIVDVRALLLEKGIPDSQIHFEKFFA